MIHTIYPTVIPLSDLFDAFEMAKSVIIPDVPLPAGATQ